MKDLTDLPEALKVNGMAEAGSIPLVDGYCETEDINRPDGCFVKITDRIPYWYDKEGTKRRPVAFNIAIARIWQPFPSVKEIRPTDVGEMWHHNIDGYAHTDFDHRDVIHFIRVGYAPSTLDRVNKVIHNKNGWTLLYSPDKEVMERIKVKEDVERIKIIPRIMGVGVYQFAVVEGDIGKLNIDGKELDLEIPKESS